MLPANWTVWALLEGVLSATISLISKAIGLRLAFWQEGFTVAVLLGIFQALAGFIFALAYRVPLVPSKRFLLWCLALGTTFGLQNALIYIALAQGADVGIYAFFGAGVAMVPVALLDMFVFRTRLTWRGWLGVIIVMLGGYAMLNFPSLAAIVRLPGWFGLALLAMLLFALNQNFSRMLATVDAGGTVSRRAIVQSVWVGSVSALVCTGIAIVYGGLSFALLPLTVYAGVSASGVLLAAMLASRLIAFSSGVNSPLRTTVATGTSLAGIAIGGALLYAEPFGVGKLIGIILYPIAYFLLRSDMQRTAS